MREKLIIGTRGSKLALIQAEMVKSAWREKFPELELEVKTIKTTGDIFKEASLAEIGGKELFTKEIDEALIKGEIDIAVHSLKDVPGIISSRQEIVATLPRADARDALVGAKSFAELPPGAIVGSASPRRTAQILNTRPDLKVVNFRGNVPSRVKKVEEKQVDCTLLAIAGLARLNLKVKYYPLSIKEMLPCAGQGVIAIAARSDDDKTKNIAAKINHEETFTVINAERAVLKTYNGDCRTPIAAYAVIKGDEIHLDALIAGLEGEKIFRTSLSGKIEEAKEIGIEVGKKLLAAAKGF